MLAMKLGLYVRLVLGEEKLCADRTNRKIAGVVLVHFLLPIYKCIAI